MRRVVRVIESAAVYECKGPIRIFLPHGDKVDPLQLGRSRSPIRSNGVRKFANGCLTTRYSIKVDESVPRNLILIRVKPLGSAAHTSTPMVHRNRTDCLS